MRALEQLAEQRIAEASARGEFSDLPGAGQPLCLDDDALVPEELRAVYRILRNAGYVPPQVRNLAELAELVESDEQETDPVARQALARRMTHLSVCLGERLGMMRNVAYRQRALRRLAKGESVLGSGGDQSLDEPEPPSG